MRFRILVLLCVFILTCAYLFFSEEKNDISVNRIVIDSINLEERLVSSYSISALENGAVFDPETIEANNWVIYGHRFSNRNPFKIYFRNLDRLMIGDQIKIYFRESLYVFEVSNIFVVKSTDLWAISEPKTRTLTLVTCTPILNPVNRLIVIAGLVSIY